MKFFDTLQRFQLLIGLIILAIAVAGAMSDVSDQLKHIADRTGPGGVSIPTHFEVRLADSTLIVRNSSNGNEPFKVQSIDQK